MCVYCESEAGTKAGHGCICVFIVRVSLVRRLVVVAWLPTLTQLWLVHQSSAYTLTIELCQVI